MHVTLTQSFLFTNPFIPLFFIHCFVHRTCLILMVESTTEYTDLLTVSFRQLAMKWKDKDFKLVYMDTYRQASFFKKLELSDDYSKKTCENGYKSRSVCACML